MTDHRPLDGEMDIDDAPLVSLVIGEMPVADIHAADKPLTAVDDQDFPVVSQVEEDTPPHQRRRQEALDAHGGLLEIAANGRQRIAVAQRVDQYAHFDAALRRLDQGGGKPTAGFVRFEDIGGKADPGARRLDRLDHGGVGFLAVMQRLHEVAGDKGAAGDTVDQVEQTGEVLRHDGRRRISRLVDMVALGCQLRDSPAALLPVAGTGADPVDPEKPVDEDTDAGQSETDHQPAQGGPGVAFAEQRVDGGEYRQGEKNAPQNQVEQRPPFCSASFHENIPSGFMRF